MSRALAFHMLPLLWVCFGANITQAASPGAVVAWGESSFGRPTVPTIPIEAQSGVVAIAAGAGYKMVLKTDGSVLAWGNGFSGATNVPVVAQSGVTAIAAGAYLSVALKNDGSVVVWGESESIFGFTNIPVVAQSGVTAIAAGAVHAVALLGGPVPLQARRSGNELVLTWPVNGFTLQSTLALSSTAAWVDVTNAPGLQGAHWAVTNTVPGSAQFYRLKKPEQP